jgi:hypothetical protein
MQQVYTAYDTSGQNKLTDTDQIMEQRRREMADQAFRTALQSNQNNMQREGWGREDARYNQNMSAQERIAGMNNANQLAMNGSYGDRSAQATRLAEMQMTPARMAQELESTKWNEGAGLRKSQNDWQQKLNDMRSGLFDSPMGGGEQTANDAIKAGFSVTDPEGYGVTKFDSAGGARQAAPRQSSGMDQNMRLKLALLGINPQTMEDPQDAMIRQATNKALADKLASGEMNPEEFSAAARGDFSAIPKRTFSAISPEQQIAAMQGDVERFGQKDAQSIGFDPVEEDVQRIVSQRDQAAKALKSQNPRLSDAQAIEGANFYIEQSLKKDGTDQRWGTEWITRLREALRGSASPAAPAAPRSTGLDMGEWQG